MDMDMEINTVFLAVVYFMFTFANDRILFAYFADFLLMPHFSCDVFANL
jgi:hypothetical protein